MYLIKKRNAEWQMIVILHRPEQNLRIVEIGSI